jgi:hypothetical protein
MENESWEAFASRNPDLLDWRNSILRKYYRDATLASEDAKRQFVMPDANLYGRSLGSAGRSVPFE